MPHLPQDADKADFRQHAHSGNRRQLPEGDWITRAPSLRREQRCSPRCRTKCGHGLYLYAAAETLGTSREELVDLMLAGKRSIPRSSMIRR